MFKNPSYTQEEHAVVFGFMDYLAEEFLRHGVSVVYDANFNQYKHRKKLNQIAKRAGANYRLVWIKTSEEKAKERLEKRAKIKDDKKKDLYRPIDVQVFEEMKGEMRYPTDKEPIIEIDGHDPFSKQFKSFQKQLQ